MTNQPNYYVRFWAWEFIQLDNRVFKRMFLETEVDFDNPWVEVDITHLQQVFPDDSEATEPLPDTMLATFLQDLLMGQVNLLLSP